MKTRTLILSILLLIAIFPAAFGKIIDLNTAREVATNFLSNQITNHVFHGNPGSVNLMDLKTRESKEQPAFYVFSINGDGFIIVSADDELVPILGYSYTGSFPETGTASGFDYLLRNFVDQIEFVRTHPILTDPEVKQQWDQYLIKEVKTPVRAATVVEPLLSCTWDQGELYNIYCPVDPAGPGGHVYSGCVATAMSMVMYYYRYPIHGTGSHTYNAIGYGNQSANYGSTYYDWDGMVDALNNNSGSSINAISLLQYHAGVAVNMNYSPDGSGAYSFNVPAAMKSYFGYANSSQYIERASYSAVNWENIVVDQLDNLKPVYYAGTDPTPVTGGGHAWVCDGYQVNGSTKTFHFNFGWSGYGNGYYTLANPNGFTADQTLIRNMVPGSNYPYGCSSKIITGTDGTFEDGSSLRQAYSPNSNCTWLIDPADSIFSISLSFNSFDVDPSDMLYIYDGSDETAPLLGSYTGSDIPQSVNSSGGKLYLKFVTDGSGEAKGWVAEYHSQFPSYCGGSMSLLSPSGTFSDGSGENDYINNATCKWKIQPPYATDLTITFTHFDLEQNDQLMVYSIGSSTALLATLTGNQIPSPIVSPTGGFLLMFKANPYNTATGFEGYYTTSNVGTDKFTGITNLTISPNPAKNYIVLQMAGLELEKANLIISDMTGKVLLTDQINSTKGLAEKSINLTDFKPGMYFLTLRSDKGRICRKFVVE